VSGGVGGNPLVVSFNSQATLPAVQAIVRNVVFSSDTEAPSTKTRTVTFTLRDGNQNTSVPTSVQVAVQSRNDAPQLSLSGTMGYVHDSPAVTLAAFATVDDPDSRNFSGGRLRVWIASGRSSSNRLEIGPAFSVDSSGNVSLNGVVIGKRVSSGFGASDLIVTFTAKASPSIAEQLVRAIRFRTVNGSPGTRSVKFTVSDGDGGVSQEQTKNVNVS
jgi:hypothetical protein